MLPAPIVVNQLQYVYREKGRVHLGNGSRNTVLPVGRVRESERETETESHPFVNPLQKNKKRKPQYKYLYQPAVPQK